MTKRKIWGDREPIAGADLTDIGNYSESAVGDLTLGFGPGHPGGHARPADNHPVGQRDRQGGQGPRHRPQRPPTPPAGPPGKRADLLRPPERGRPP
jgi:hypothetical protein